MKKRVSLCVLAHPKRADRFPYLRERLGDVPFSIDDGCGVIENERRAWMSRDPEADWHVVMEDDALVCRDFYPRLLSVLDTAERERCRAVNLFYGALPGEREAEQGRTDGFVKRPSMNWGLAIALPIPLVDEMIPFVLALGETAVHFDWGISLFLQARGILTLYPLPSLVEHGDEDVSLLGGRPGRRAFWYED